MIDIESFITSLKINWIKRLLNSTNAKWKHIYNKQLESFGGTLLFRSNINEKTCENLNIKSRFLKEMIQSWSKANLDKNKISISKQLLWNNENIKDSRKKTFFYNDWFNNGVQFIEHVYDFRNKTFYNFPVFSRLYNVKTRDYLKYHTLINNIPKKWKEDMKNEIMMYSPSVLLLDKIHTIKKVNKFIYDILIKQRIPAKRKNHCKWEYEIENFNPNWDEIYTNYSKYTIDTKLRAFQYKYIMRIIPNNSFLFKCKIIASNLCQFCNMYTDTNRHMF